MAERKGNSVSFRGQKGLDRQSIFWSKVCIKNSSECWEFLGSKNRDGYGQFWIGNTFVASHRYAYQSYYGNILEGLLILHKCDNPSCCNPSHLYSGTQSDNMSDRQSRNPVSPIATSHPKFLAGEIILIRRLRVVKSVGKYIRFKFSETFIAKMFKTHQSVIHRIWTSETYLAKEGYYV